MSKEGTEVLICILFERNDYEPLQTLYNYGLGNDAIKKLMKNKDNAAGSLLSLRTYMSMNDFIDTSKQDKLPFYIYSGNNPNTDCGQAINMVYAEPLWVGSEHLAVFSMAAQAEYKARETYETIIYQNMYNQSKFPMLHNATMVKSPMQESPFPGPLTHLPFMFMPEDGTTMGNLNLTFFGVWRDKPKDGIFVEPEVAPEVVQFDAAPREIQIPQNRLAAVPPRSSQPEHLRRPVHHDRPQSGATGRQDSFVVAGLHPS